MSPRLLSTLSRTRRGMALCTERGVEYPGYRPWGGVLRFMLWENLWAREDA